MGRCYVLPWGTIVGALQMLCLSIVTTTASSSNLAQRTANPLSASTSQSEETGIIEQTTLPLLDVAHMDVDNPPATLTDGGSTTTSRSPSSEIMSNTPSSTTVRNKDSNTLLQDSTRGADKEKTSSRVKEEPSDVQPAAAVVSCSYPPSSIVI
jgi:hypothetical protein